VLVHIPALLAKALIPSLYPLRLALFDPLTQVRSKMAELAHACWTQVPGELYLVIADTFPVGVSHKLSPHLWPPLGRLRVVEGGQNPANWPRV